MKHDRHTHTVMRNWCRPVAQHHHLRGVGYMILRAKVTVLLKANISKTVRLIGTVSIEH